MGKRPLPEAFSVTFPICDFIIAQSTKRYKLFLLIFNILYNIHIFQSLFLCIFSFSLSGVSRVSACFCIICENSSFFYFCGYSCYFSKSSKGSLPGISHKMAYAREGRYTTVSEKSGAGLFQKNTALLIPRGAAALPPFRTPGSEERNQVLDHAYFSPMKLAMELLQYARPKA